MQYAATFPAPRLPDLGGALRALKARLAAAGRKAWEQIVLMGVVFTSAGEGLAADYFDGTASAPANWYIAWGTGTNSAAKGDTALQTEAAESRVTATKTQPSADKNRLVGTITATGSKTITEAGVFTASSSGTMPVRGDFSGIAVVSGDSIEFTIEIEWT
jgi:hypothetical protein